MFSTLLLEVFDECRIIFELVNNSRGIEMGDEKGTAVVRHQLPNQSTPSKFSVQLPIPNCFASQRLLFGILSNILFSLFLSIAPIFMLETCVLVRFSLQVII